MRAFGKIRALTMAAVLAGCVSPAFSHGRVGTHAWAGTGTVPIVRVHGPYRGAWGWGWGWGYPYGWGFWGGPWWYGPQSVDVRHITYGAIDFNVKPLNSQVYVDNKYLGTVGDLNGRHHEADLPQGMHQVKVVGPAGQVAEREVYVAAGVKIKFSHQFEV